MFINQHSKIINCKLVYYGPGLSGKTTNIQKIFERVEPENRSPMRSLETENERTLFFDFLPLELGKIRGYSVRFHLYSVPGQVYYEASRKLVLRGVDGIVFVADSQSDRLQSNIESLKSLEINLSHQGYKMDKIPMILQYNKRDLAQVSSIEELQKHLNKRDLPFVEGVASKGIGVIETLKMLTKLVLSQLKA